jgi:hypothetical protein
MPVQAPARSRLRAIVIELVNSDLARNMSNDLNP